MCPKSYLYIYDFRAIYINVHSNRLDRSGPVLSSAGSLHLPSGGTCFPTEPRGQFLLLMSMSMPMSNSSPVFKLYLLGFIHTKVKAQCNCQSLIPGFGA